jgi:energy-coupling factor transporter ATP-binding protein EcfA2
MIIDFTVANYRSIRDPVTLSFVEVSPRKKRQLGSTRKRPIKTDEEISPALNVPGWDFKLLRAAGIFGANASGKSNVVRALGAVLELVAHGPAEPRLREVASPFLLSPEGKGAPTEFTLRVAVPGAGENLAIFTYRLAVRGAQIVEERLTEERRDEVRLIFERRAGSPSRSGDVLPAAMGQLLASMAPEAPFLHMLVKNFDLPALRGLRAGFQVMRTAHEGQEGYIAGLARLVLQEPGFEQLNPRVAELLRDFDTGIAGFRLEPGPEKHQPRVFMRHDTPAGSVEWELDQESAGTRRLFDLAPSVLLALDWGGLVILDEFGSQLHPHITQRIVALFQNPATNPKGAQLLFNTHDNTLMRDNLLRRDQIWFTEKGVDGNTTLYPLADFKPRKDLAIDSAYLDGRMGAVPVLPPAEAMVPPPEATEAKP